MDVIGIVIISIVAVLLAVGLCLLIRHLKNEQDIKYDIVTKYGTKIKLSESAKDINVKLFEEWTDSVVSFWVKNEKWPADKCYNLFNKIKIYIYDDQYIKRNGIKLSGAFWPSTNVIEITTVPKNGTEFSLLRVSSLFRHESSHALCQFVGNIAPGDLGENHHQLFAKFSLGA